MRYKKIMVLVIQNLSSQKKNEVYAIEVGARMGGDFIGSNLVQLSTGYDFLKGVIDVSLGDFKEPSLRINKYFGVFFLC